MKKALYLLVQIVLIKFLILFCFTAKSEINEYCEENSKIFAGNKHNIKYPKSIYIEVINSNKWFTRLLRSIYSESGRIDKKYKKYQKARIIVNFDSDIKCIFKGRVRIHGGGNDHIDSATLSSSIRVILEDGHIGHKYNFALIIARTDTIGGRDASEEIFASSLFEEIGFLSPLHFNLKVRINSEIDRDYIFVEIPTLEMVKDQGRNNGVFLAGNKNNFSDKENLGSYPNTLILNRVKTPYSISKRNKNVLLYSLDKLNYINLNSHGIGNGEDCCKEDKTPEDEILKNLYKERNYNLNINNYIGEDSVEKSSIFNLLLNIINAHHGLSAEDRVYFYDPMFDTIEPVYNDADSNILKKEKLEFSRIFEIEKKYITKLRNKIASINLSEFRLKLLSKRLDIKPKELDEIFQNIKNNLDLIEESSSLYSYSPIYAKNYFKNHIDKSIPFYLAFEGENNIFEICDIKLEKCETEKLEDEVFYKLIKDKFINIKGYDNKVLYVRNSKNAYINNTKPISKSIKKFQSIKLNENFSLYFNNSKENIFIDKEEKKIKLKQVSENDRFIFIGVDQRNWFISLEGINSNNAVPYKRDNNMIGGCISFINSKLEKISLKIFNSQCPKAVEILLSDVKFSDIEIFNSAGDGFDAEFSDIYVEKIISKKSKGECIGVKRGNYYFNKVFLSYCGDKAYSSGEHSFSKINSIKVDSSISGIVSKDSSSVEVFNYQIENSEKCLWSFRSKFQYNGALIKIKKENFNCNGSKIQVDANSLIEYF